MKEIIESIQQEKLSDAQMHFDKGLRRIIEKKLDQKKKTIAERSFIDDAIEGGSRFVKDTVKAKAGDVFRDLGDGEGFEDKMRKIDPRLGKFDKQKAAETAFRNKNYYDAVKTDKKILDIEKRIHSLKSKDHKVNSPEIERLLKKLETYNKEKLKSNEANYLKVKNNIRMPRVKEVLKLEMEYMKEKFDTDNDTVLVRLKTNIDNAKRKMTTDEIEEYNKVKKSINPTSAVNEGVASFVKDTVVKGSEKFMDDVVRTGNNFIMSGLNTIKKYKIQNNYLGEDKRFFELYKTLDKISNKHQDWAYKSTKRFKNSENTFELFEQFIISKINLINLANGNLDHKKLSNDPILDKMEEDETFEIFNLYNHFRLRAQNKNLKDNEEKNKEFLSVLNELLNKAKRYRREIHSTDDESTEEERVETSSDAIPNRTADSSSIENNKKSNKKSNKKKIKKQLINKLKQYINDETDLKNAADNIYNDLKAKNRLVESVPKITWRRNSRTGLNKIVLTCRKGEYKEKNNRIMHIAGSKVKDVRCLPVSSKPAQQRIKDRKSSIKRWKKIHSNPSLMKKMNLKKQITKQQSKVLRK